MRVVSGIYKGRVLLEFKGKEIRPTADRTKESLFDIIKNKVYGSVFLDLFSGTGSIGIEAVSRNAKKVVFVDNSKESVCLTQKNLEKLNILEKVYFEDGLFYLNSTKEKFDIVFIDPPYLNDIGIKSLETIAKKKVLSENGIAIYERDRAFDKSIEGLELYDERKYGKAYLSFFRYEKKDTEV